MKMMFLMSLMLLFVVACGKDKKKKTFHLSEDIQMNATIFSNQIALSNVMKTMSAADVNTCGPAPMPGKVYYYGIMNNILTIDDQRVQVRYQRVTNLGGIFGVWQFVSATDPKMASGTMEITSNSVRFISNCN